MPHIHFTFPEDLKKTLEKHVPLRERSRFVSRATAQALQMQKMKEILASKKHVGTYHDVDPESWIRSLRKKGRRIRSRS